MEQETPQTPPKGKPARPAIATLKHPTIEAVLGEHFRFGTEKQALERIEGIRGHFLRSKHQPPGESAAAVIVWIKGYGLSYDEEQKGYVGNYALVTYKPVPSAVEGGQTKFTLFATKLESDLKYHPQRKRPRRKHPDWGHPILRAVKRGRVYATTDEAQGELQRLHEEYPTVSIPCTLKMYIMIYGGEAPPPVKKYVLTVEAAENGGYVIRYKLNEYKGKRETQARQEEEAQQPEGYFTSMIELKRQRKNKRNAGRPVTGLTPEEGE